MCRLMTEAARVHLALRGNGAEVDDLADALAKRVPRATREAIGQMREAHNAAMADAIFRSVARSHGVLVARVYLGGADPMALGEVDSSTDGDE